MSSSTTLHTPSGSQFTYRVVYVAARAVRAVCFTAFCLLALLSLALASATAMSPRSSLSIMGHDVMIVRSGSMSPSIETGDAVLVRRTNGESNSRLRISQIVSFRTAANSPALSNPQSFTLRDSKNLIAGSTFVSLGLADMRVPTTGGPALSPTWVQSGATQAWVYATFAFRRDHSRVWPVGRRFLATVTA